MKQMKVLGLLTVAIAALMAFAPVASATTVTSPSGSTYTGGFSASAEGHVVLDNPIAEIACSSLTEGSVEGHGAGVTVVGAYVVIQFSFCTNNWHVTVIAAGVFSIHSLGGGWALITSKGLRFTATRFGISCTYETNETSIGTITSGEHATLDISAAIPFSSGSGLCGSGATTWTGSYKFNSPTNWSVD